MRRRHGRRRKRDARCAQLADVSIRQLAQELKGLRGGRRPIVLQQAVGLRRGAKARVEDADRLRWEVRDRLTQPHEVPRVGVELRAELADDKWRAGLGLHPEKVIHPNILQVLWEEPIAKVALQVARRPFDMRRVDKPRRVCERDRLGEGTNQILSPPVAL